MIRSHFYHERSKYLAYHPL